MMRYTPLTYAVLFNQPAIADLLLEKGANFEIELSNSFNPLLLALCHKREEILQIFVNHEISFDQELPSLHFPILFCFPNCLEILQLALKLGGINLHHQFSGQKSYLHWAALFQDQPLCEFLIESGINVNHLDATQRNVLHIATAWENAALISLFLQKGVNARCLSITGLTPIMHLEMSSRSSPDAYQDLKEADQGLTPLIRRLNLLGLRFSLKGEIFEGSPSFLTYTDLAHSLTHYLHTEPNLPPFFSTLPNIIEDSTQHNLEEILTILKQGGIVSLSCGWPGHETVIIVTEELLIRPLA